MPTTLETTVDELRVKADKYQEATNFEAKLQEYQGKASAIKKSLGTLKNRLQDVERLNGIYTRVFGYDTPGKVEDARHHTQQVLGRTEEDYWLLIDEGRVDQYDTEIQTAKSKIDSARRHLQEELNNEKGRWVSDVRSARRIQTLMADSLEAERLLDDIEEFVVNRIWDEKTSVASLRSKWQGLKKAWESGVVSWDEFQRDNNLSDDTIEKLKQLATGENVSFQSLDEDIVGELLDVDELRNVLEVTL